MTHFRILAGALALLAANPLLAQVPGDEFTNPITIFVTVTIG